MDSTSIFTLVLIDLLLKIVGNDPSVFTHAYCVCKSWYELLFPHLEFAKSYGKGKELLGHQYKGQEYTIYKGVNSVKGDFIISRVTAVGGPPEHTFEVSRMNSANCYFCVQVVYHHGVWTLVIDSGEYENFRQNGEFSSWAIDCEALHHSKLDAIRYGESSLWQNGKLICYKEIPFISIRRLVECGDALNKSLAFQECKE